ncbi:MAG: hypothetical protein K2J79_05250 [Ruminiclostridium sp.]|nr:hypothetical protein [Ruminiclostridium sp.]
MKKFLMKLKRPVCAIITIICLFLLLGCTETAELGGDLTTYTIQGAVLLSTAIIAGIIGGFFE